MRCSTPQAAQLQGACFSTKYSNKNKTQKKKQTSKDTVKLTPETAVLLE